MEIDWSQISQEIERGYPFWDFDPDGYLYLVLSPTLCLRSESNNVSDSDLQLLESHFNDI